MRLSAQPLVLAHSDTRVQSCGTTYAAGPPDVVAPGRGSDGGTSFCHELNESTVL